MSIATPAQLAAFLGVTFTPEQEAQAQAVLDVADALLQAYCNGVQFTREVDDVLRLYGFVPVVLHLPGGPVESVASVTVNGEPVDGWVLIGDSIVRSTFYDIPWSQVASTVVEVTYTHGLDEPPPELVAAELLVAARMWSVPLGVRSEQLGAESVTYVAGDESAALNGAERALLAPYRLSGATTTVFA